MRCIKGVSKLYIVSPSVLYSAMIEKVCIGAKDPNQKGRYLRAKAVLRTAQFIEDKTNYDQKRTGLFTLQPRAQKPSSRAVKCGIQKRFAVGYIHRYGGLFEQSQRFSSKGSPTRSTLYAKNTKCNNESHKDLKSSICRSYQKRVSTSKRGNFKHFESNKSGALSDYESSIEINISDLEISLFSAFGKALVFSFLRVSISALLRPDIMSISVLNKAQIGTQQKS